MIGFANLTGFYVMEEGALHLFLSIAVNPALEYVHLFSQLYNNQHILMLMPDWFLLNLYWMFIWPQHFSNNVDCVEMLYLSVSYKYEPLVEKYHMISLWHPFRSLFKMKFINPFLSNIFLTSSIIPMYGLWFVVLPLWNSLNL